MSTRKSHNRIHIARMDADGFARLDIDDEKTLVVLEITKRDVLSKNLSSSLERLFLLTDNSESVVRFQESLLLQFEGWDSDARELPQIEEVREYLAALVDKWPHFIWFLAREAGALALLFSCLCRVSIVRNPANPGQFGTQFEDAKELQDKFMAMVKASNPLFVFTWPLISDEMTTESTKSALTELGILEN